MTSGHDPIIGQANVAGDRARVMDEPIPNYPVGNVRSAAQLPTDFIVPTAAAYFFMPSLSALRTVVAAPSPIPGFRYGMLGGRPMEVSCRMPVAAIGRVLVPCKRPTAYGDRNA